MSVAGQRWLLLAQEVAEKAAQGAADPGGAAPAVGESPLFFLAPLGVIMVLYFVMILGPERRRQKEKQQQIGALKKNDKVLTIGGIYGVVANVKPGEEELVLKIDEDKDVKIRVAKSSIAQVLAAKEPEKEEGG